MYYIEKWSPGLSYILVTPAPTAYIASRSHSEILHASWYFSLTSIHFRNMLHVLKGKKARLNWPLPGFPTSLGTRVGKQAASIVVDSLPRDILASALSFGVHVSICWLPQCCPTWYTEEIWLSVQKMLPQTWKLNQYSVKLSQALFKLCDCIFPSYLSRGKSSQQDRKVSHSEQSTGVVLFSFNICPCPLLASSKCSDSWLGFNALCCIGVVFVWCKKVFTCCLHFLHSSLCKALSCKPCYFLHL